MSLLRQIVRTQRLCSSTSIRSISSATASGPTSSLAGRTLHQKQVTSTSSTLSHTQKRYQSTLYQTATAAASTVRAGDHFDNSTGSRNLPPPPGAAAGKHGNPEHIQNQGQGQQGHGDDHHQDDEGAAAAADAATEDEQRFKDDLLELALNHVKTVGWSREAISRAAVEAGLSPAVGSMFQDVDLVYYFISKNNEGLEKHLADLGKDVDVDVPNLRQALEWRLQKVVPYAATYSEAIALISAPEYVSKSVGLLMDIADTIAHHSLKDSSTDLNWYSKRIGIAGIFVSTELCLVQDKSEGYSETWKFLERRCQEFDKYGKGQLHLTSVPLPELLHVGFTTVLNLIGRNARR